MASTEDKRKWYPEHVTNHADRGTAGYKPKCNWSGAALVAFPNNLDGVYIEPVHPKTWEAWDAYVFLMDHFGETMTNAGGVNHCRNIGTSVWPSLHAYIIAVDLPPNDRKSAGFQAAVLKVKTKSGKTVFKNLASINDRMHDEIDCSPADLATGIDWTTVEGYVTEDEMTPELQAEFDALKAAVAAVHDEVWTHGHVVDPVTGKEIAPSAWQIHIRTKADTTATRLAVGALDLEGITEAELDERVALLVAEINEAPDEFRLALKAAL